MKEIRKELESLVIAFKMGKLTGWRTTTSNVKGYSKIIFETTENSDQIFWKLNK